MAINDFVRRSIQIVGGGIAQSTTDYFDNAVSFVNDAKEIIDMGIQMGSDGTKKFNELKSSGILKKTRDWLYNEGGMFGDFDFDDDDFDAGFEIDSADSEASTDSSKPLSKDMMTDIAKKQTGAMYKAFGRQADLHIANTAEIISTINTRTAELTASVNNVNNTLIQIGKRLDLIVEWTTARTKKEEEEKRVAGILDYGGGISLSGVVNKAKENAEDSMLGTFLSIGKTMLGSGMMTPETVLSMILSQTILEKKWDKLGGKSINDIGEFINDTVGEVIQNTMTKVLTSKNDILESLFEDIITRSGRKNYQNSVTNTYNDKPAVFDGMTRKSIITVIPGYLNEILKAVSKDGVGREVDSKGNLTKSKTNSFVKEVADSYFRSGTMEWSRRKAAAERTKLDETEVTHAVRTLTGCWVWYLYRSGRVILEVGEVKNILAESTRSVVNNAAYMMATADPKHRSEDEWKELYQGIIEQIDEFKYRQELQRSAERADKNLETFAKSHVNNHQAKTVDESVILQAFRHNYSDFNKDAKFRNPSEPESTGASPTAIGSGSNPLSITELDYMAGIFDRLNRGLNVFITGQKDNRDHQYKKITMIPGYAARKLRGGGTSSSDDADETGIKPAVNKLKDVISHSDKKKEKMDDATKEAYEAKERGEELSKEQEKLLKDFDKKNGILGKIGEGGKWLKSKITHFADESRKEYFMDPATREVSEAILDIFSDVKKKVSDITPDFIKEKLGDIKRSKAGQTVSDRANAAKHKAEDILLGHEEMNDQGQHVRTGGVLHAVAKPLSSVGTFVGNTSAKFMTTKHLSNKVNDIFDKFKEGGSHAPGGENFNAGSNDYMHIQILSSMADAVMANGEVSTEDKQMMYKEIAAIDDKDIQKRLKQYLVPLMERNSKSNDKTGTGEQKSPLGKLGSMLLSAGKLAFAGVFVYIKGVIKTVFGIIKYGLKGIFKLAKWGIMRGLRQIKYGAKSMFQGIKQVFEPLTKGIKHGINIAFKAFEGLKNSLSKGFSSMFSGLSEKLSKWNENRKERKAEREAEGKTMGQRLGGIPQKISDAKSKLIDKIGGNGNGFVGGFFSARNERKAAEAKAKADAESKPMRDAMEQTGIPEIRTAAEDVADVLKDESITGKGFMKPVIKLLRSILEQKEKESQPDEETPELPIDDIDFSQSGKSKESGESGESKEQDTEMPDIGGASSTDLGGGGAPDIGADGGDAGGGGAEGDAEGGGKGGGLKDGLGKILGGIENMMGGLLNVVVSIVMSLEGAKAIINLVMTILTESLQPLNEAFQALMKAFKPILKQLGGIIKQLAEFIVVIVEAVVDVIKPILTDVIQPILEVLSPLLQAILGAVTPILKVVGILLKVILAPLMGLFKFVLLPILKIIGDAVQIIMGVIQIGFGLIMGAIGTVIAAIGAVISAIPGAGGKGKGIKDSGKNMFSQGAEFVASGVKSVAQGAINLALDYASFYTLGASDELLGRNDEEKKEPKKIEAPDSNSVEETYASGDVTNIYNTYGGEYQRGMGGYLNMNQRGCGPIALADMYNRNNEGRISARSLAGSMYSSGRYDPRRGTSVGDYIDTAHSMGMNLTPGKVTQQTLKSASPTHPITVVGSGADYGTRRGNNHFMNVIGTDSHGTAFVSNPLTGRIDRKPASTIAGSAVMGLYGSGDEAGEDAYTFPEAIKEAFQKLKDEAAKVLGLFTMEKSDEEETNDLINEEQNKNATEQAKRQLQSNNSELYEKYEAQAKIDARKAYEEKYPKKDGQSDEEYEKGFEDFWNKNSAQYLARAVVEDKTMSEAAKEDFDEKSGYREIAGVSSDFVDKVSASFAKVGEEADKAESSFGTNGSGRGNVNDIYEAASQVWEGYVKKVPSGEYSFDDKGPITTRSGVVIPEIHPDCSGMLSATMNYMGYDFRGTMNGSTNRWTTSDLSGKTKNDFIYKDGELTDDWAIIPYSADELKEGDIITTPGHVGLYVEGNSSNAKGFDAGDTTGKRTAVIGNGLAKAYLDGDSDWKSQLQWTMGPGYPGLTTILRYVKAMPGQGKVELTGQLGDYSAWSGYSGRAGVPTFINAGKAAGMSGAEIATLMSTGIWEDGGEKIFGLKSLNDTTYDYNGQAAKGIMNWVDQDVNYGNTVTDQLKWIHNTYFDSGSNDWRAKVRDNGYLSQDTQAFRSATGRSGFTLNMGDRYGPHADQDLVEGSAWFFMDALVPEKIHTAKGMAENVGTAAEAYNWMIDNGYIDVSEDNPSNVSKLDVIGGSVNNAGDARMLSNLEQIGTRSGKNTGVVFTNDGDGLWLQTKPQYGSKGIIIIPDGTQLNLETSGSKEWFKTSWAGNDGYVCANYIKLGNNDITNAYKTQSYDYDKLNTNKNTYNKLLDYATNSTGGNSSNKNSSGNTGNSGSSGNNGNSSSGKGTTNNVTYKAKIPNKNGEWDGDTFGLGANDVIWDPSFYTNNDNFSSFMVIDDGSMRAKPHGVFTNLAAASEAIGKSYKNKDKYWDNLLHATNNDDLYAESMSTKLGKVASHAYDWINMRQKYITKKDQTFPGALQSVHYGLFGSGDAADVLAEDQFWNDYLGWNNRYSSNVTRGLSDGSDTAYSSDTYYDTETGTTVVNNYAVTRAEDKATDARLKAILANTYNVRSESMEALLEAILEELKKRRNPRGGGNDTNGSTKLFDERIPAQVTKLSIG